MTKVIFDLDGTLIDSAPLIAGILNEMLAERGAHRTVAAAEARAYLTQGGTQLVAALLGSTGKQVLDDLARFRSLYVSRPTPANCLFPGVGEGLRALSRLGVRMATCSNKPQALCDKIIAELALTKYCPVVVGSMSGVPLKPAADLAVMAVEKLGAVPEDCLFVGDSEVDRQTAANAGIPFLFVTYGYAEAGATIDAVARFDRFEELIRFVSEDRARSSTRRLA